MPGYKSSIVFFPESGDAIVILTNKITPANGYMATVLKQYLQDPSGMNWVEADKNMYKKNLVYSWDRPADTTSRSKVGIPNVKEYEGIYIDSVYGKAIIRTEKGKTTLELSPAKKLFTGPLYYAGKDQFSFVFNDGFIPVGEIIFQRGKNNVVKSFMMKVGSSDFNFEELYFKKK
jgi:hypothetical protein